jgi:hypothetical protein
LACLTGAAIAFGAGELVAGAVVAAVPTLFLMVVKPTFALCLMMLVLPFGAGLAVPGVFTLNKGIGIILALSFALNLLLVRPRLDCRNWLLWAAVVYCCWAVLSVVFHPLIELEAIRSLTQIQLLILFLVVYWILRTNTMATFIWSLRCYLLGTVGSILFVLAMGTQLVSSPEGRFTATLGAGQINANHYGALVGLALLVAIYLIHRDRLLRWRLLYLASIPFISIILLKVGSRGALIAVPLSVLIAYAPWIRKKPKLIFGIGCVALIIGAVGFYFLQHASLDVKLLNRLTDIDYAADSIALRISFIGEAIGAALRWPMGTGYAGWFERTGLTHVPHNDLFFVLGVYGWPGMMAFAGFMLGLIYHVARMESGFDKLFAVLALSFILLIGLKGGYVAKQFFWAFLAYTLAAGQVSGLSPKHRIVIGLRNTASLRVSTGQ